MHWLFTAFVYHVSPQVLHLVITAIAIVARESPLSARPPSILGQSTHVEPHFRIICNQEEIIRLKFQVTDRDRRSFDRR